MKRVIALLMLSSVYCHITYTVAMEEIEPQRTAEEKAHFVLSESMENKFKNFFDIIQRRDVVCAPTGQKIINYDQGSLRRNQDFLPKDSYTISKHLKSGGRYQYGCEDDFNYLEGFELEEAALKFRIKYQIENEEKYKNFSYLDLSKTDKLPIALNFFMIDVSEKDDDCKYEDSFSSYEQLDLRFQKRIENSSKYENILSGSERWQNNTIQAFAKNVLTILKHETDRLVLQPGEALEPSLKVGALILTSERFRSEKALLIAYIEFLKLKCDPSKECLEKMFFGKEPTLIFPAKGGQRKIVEASFEELCAAFADLGKYQKILGKYQEIVEAKDANDFFDKMLWEVWKIHELYHEYHDVINALSVINPLINSAPEGIAGKLYPTEPPKNMHLIENSQKEPNERYLSFIYDSLPNFWCNRIEPAISIPLKLYPKRRRLYIENNFVTRCDDGKELYLADIKERGCRICNESYPLEESIIQKKGQLFSLRCKNFPKCEKEQKLWKKPKKNNSSSTVRRFAASLSKRTKPNITPTEKSRTMSHK